MPDLSLKNSLERLRDVGFRPESIFDIGVATGTRGLYSVFDDARYLLVDPLQESEPFMQVICAKFPGAAYVVAAVSAQPGEIELAVHPGLSGSGAYLKGDFERRKVPAVTLDHLVDEHGLLGPFLVKIDVQGAEIQVMQGLQKHVDKAEIVVAEVSLWADRKKSGSPTFAQLIAYFDSRGFVLYDVPAIAYRERDGAVAEMDLVFCRHDSDLRRHSSYRTPEQAAAKEKTKRAKFDVPEKANL